MIAFSAQSISRLVRRTYNATNCPVSRFSTEIVKSETSVATQDFLLQTLKNAQTTNKVFQLVSQHSTIMNKNHLMQALRTLFTLQKHGLSQVSTQQILKHPDFEKLCASLRKQAGLIELNETIDALKIVSYVGVSSDSTIVKVLLQLLKHNVNELSLQKIIFVDFLLHHFQRSPLVEALLIALPIVFEINLPLKMDRHDVTHMAEYLQYVSRRNVSEKCIDLIVNSVMSYRGEIDAKSALSIVWSITDMQPDVFFEPLLKKVMDVLIVDVESLSYDQLEGTLSRLTNKYLPDLPFYYNETFFDLCADYVIDHDLGFDSAVYILRKFCKLHHMNAHLLDYISKKALENNDLVLNGSASHVCSLIIGLAISDYKPEGWDSLKRLVQNSDVFQPDGTRKILWLKLAASLCALDVYKPEVLQRAFNADFLNVLINKKYRIDMENIAQVHQAVSTFRPDLLTYLPQQDFMDRVYATLKEPSEYPLQFPLQTALGGDKYVKTGLKTRLGINIDHAVMYRKGGFPVAFTSEQTETKYIENLDSSDNQLVLILSLGATHFTINGRRMRGTTSLMIKVLEEKGYSVVPICMEHWNALPDFERIPYLMQEVKTKVDTSSFNVEGVV